MIQTAKLVVVGSANMDLVVKAQRIPAPGETVLGGVFATIPGGKGANQAVAAARLGGATAFVGRVGEDAFGAILRQEMESAGVRTKSLKSDGEAPSGVALIGVSATGENAIMVAPGANGRVCEADIREAEGAIAEADWLVVQLETPLEAVCCAVDIAKRHGTKVLLNPAPAQPLPLSLLQSVDVLTPNEHEAATILGEEQEEGDGDMEGVAERLRGLGVGSVIITIGAQGCVVSDESGTRRRPAPVVQAVDTTAAGDCFSGALAVGLGEGMDIETAVAFALRAASLSVTRMGAQPSLPSRSELASFAP